ncbi:hypothetical protein [Aeoliella mucimassa]|uniref:Uncharacterized protein n=1 Tax=Aeoliella mucimassa TaxID=2527972 RepID=A0A518AGP9_9BACT|nr:hypothetical protein [Aeoliella mucimassa]QDU53869.1 hypothetical protein Pan181_00470 [Aeoliella mucimassa]
MFGFFKKAPAPDIPTGADGPDFSVVDSKKKALALVKQGTLEPLYLLPLEFGGRASASNTLYVPIGVAQIKQGIDLNQIMPLIEQGEEVEYSAEPEYQGNSMVPIALTVNAGPINATIKIWGEALGRE